ncbi:serine/threonine-protein kinase [Actinomadura rupiterrae]|uniref:serine/threonine-protein kinase n=1 Tax=Actinomadura rupiterrae TaxID=559627 RepID=UPI0020A257DA|nr:serine/threonine-protein kinase [Actinomadura rupiterrae]MCP2339876.1 serine/threonine-protein kinase [Actinomadura rupiterrae]
MDGWRIPGYTELRVLGEGGQGRVVLARHDATGRPAAIKYLTGGDAASTAFRERFVREAELLRRLRSPYIAQLFGLVRSDAGLAIVMEAVDGASLRAVLAERGPLPPEGALAVLKGSLLGLAAAHEGGVVHRDYKPANVVVRADGLSKLIDFGIAVDAGAADRSGTPLYMAPEQWRAEPASPATDVYAATCVFVECVSGSRPYPAASSEELRELHVSAPVPSGLVPEPLRPLVERGMAKDPWDRPHGAAAFVRELESAASGAYGPDWERRGVAALGTAAVALAAVFPLTAAGLGVSGAGGASAAGAGGAGAGGAGAGGASAGGQAAAGAAGKGVAAALGGKVTLAVAGTAVIVAGGGAAAYVATHPGKKKAPAPPPIAIRLAALNDPQSALPGGGTWRVNGQVVTVSGHKNPAIDRKLDAALRAPLDQRWTEAKAILGGSGGGAYTATARPTILLRGPKLLSVSYATDVQGQVGTGWDQARSVTVNLDTGAAYARPIDLFGSSSPALSPKVLAHLPGNRWCPREPVGPGITAKQLTSGEVAVTLTASGIRVAFQGAALGYSGSCGNRSADVPYGEVADLLKPEITSAVPYPATSVRPTP